VRGLIAELGWEVAQIPFNKPVRKRGITKNNFMSLLDIALLAMVTHTKLPLRIATLSGMGLSVLSLTVALYYLIRKLFFWNEFQAGIAPALIGLFFLIGLIFLFLGLIGEYVSFITTHVIHRPMVVEESRINFESKATKK
jgi:hypothetical protein